MIFVIIKTYCVIHMIANTGTVFVSNVPYLLILPIRKILILTIYTAINKSLSLTDRVTQRISRKNKNTDRLLIGAGQYLWSLV